MNYKEKYEKAIVHLKKFLDGDCVTDSEILADFPELKESEDERIRKRLLWFLANYEGRWDYPETRMACRNWLEKQKEQKPLAKIVEDKKVVTEDLYEGLINKVRYDDIQGTQDCR